MTIPSAPSPSPTSIVGDAMNCFIYLAGMVKSSVEATYITESALEGLKKLGLTFSDLLVTGKDKKAIIEHWKDFLSLGMTISTFAAVPLLDFIPVTQAFRCFIQLVMSFGELVCINKKINDIEEKVSYLNEINQFLNSLLDHNKKLNTDQLNTLVIDTIGKIKKINDELNTHETALGNSIDKFFDTEKARKESTNLDKTAQGYDLYLLQVDPIPSIKNDLLVNNKSSLPNDYKRYLPDFFNPITRNKLLLGTIFDANRLPVIIKSGELFFVFGKNEYDLLDYTPLNNPSEEIKKLTFPDINKPIKKISKAHINTKVFDTIKESKAHNESNYAQVAKAKFEYFVQKQTKEVIAPLSDEVNYLKNLILILLKNLDLSALDLSSYEDEVNTNVEDTEINNDWDLVIQKNLPILKNTAKLKSIEKQKFYLILRDNPNDTVVCFLNNAGNKIIQISVQDIIEKQLPKLNTDNESLVNLVNSTIKKNQ